MPVRVLRPLHADDSRVIRLAVPALFTLLAEPMLLLGDSIIVGRLGTSALAALGVASAVLSTVVSLCVFLAYGSTAAVARECGAGHPRRALRRAVSTVWLAVVLGATLAVAGLVLHSTIVSALGATGAVAQDARTYLGISLVGVPAMLVLLAATGVLRGLGDARTPLVVTTSAAVANVPLNVVLVHVAGLGIAGAAWGTVLAQAGAAAAAARSLVTAARRHDVPLTPDWRAVAAVGGAGVPLLVRTASLRVALILATYTATRLGPVPLAAHHVAFSVWTTVALALDALAIAAQTVVGQALGGGELERTRRLTWRLCGWGALAGVVLGVLVLVTRPAYIPWFTADPSVAQALSTALVLVALLSPVGGVVFVLDGVLIGAGDGPYLAFAGVLTLAVFAPFAAAASDLTALWGAFAVFLVARLLTLVLRARGDAWCTVGADP
ncbi:MAG: MATE family efflux transporter [Actinomycetota bacterium]|nr:MATE family efflux transporter [Actinomycetota bacterium]